MEDWNWSPQAFSIQAAAEFYHSSITAIQSCFGPKFKILDLQMCIWLLSSLNWGVCFIPDLLKGFSAARLPGIRAGNGSHDTWPHICSLTPQKWKGLWLVLPLTIKLEYATHWEKRRWPEERGRWKDYKKDQAFNMKRNVPKPINYSSKSSPGGGWSENNSHEGSFRSEGRKSLKPNRDIPRNLTEKKRKVNRKMTLKWRQQMGFWSHGSVWSIGGQGEVNGGENNIWNFFPGTQTSKLFPILLFGELDFLLSVWLASHWCLLEAGKRGQLVQTAGAWLYPDLGQIIWGVNEVMRATFLVRKAEAFLS